MNTFTTELLQKFRAIAERDQLARNTVLRLIERAHEANTADAKVSRAESLAKRLLPELYRHPNTYQSTGDAYDEGHTDGWNEALAELARLLEEEV